VRPQTRGYVGRQGWALRAEPLGRVLTAFLASYFPRYIDYGFTAGLESRLDDVSGGHRGKLKALRVMCQRDAWLLKTYQLQAGWRPTQLALPAH
jgi:DNA topoisomerase IA